MGEYAEMMLDGTCCCSCGEYIGDGDGFATYCASCEPAEQKVFVPAKQESPKPKKKIKCNHSSCSRRFVDENALKNHLRTFHIDKVALQQKQEKDKRLNIMRNAAHQLLESLEIMTQLVRLKYGNLDKEVYAEILKAEAAIAAARGE